MSRFQFALATTADDSDLRRVLSAMPMEGKIRIAFAREPSYFDAALVDGQSVQVGVCRDTTSGRVIGIGSRAISLRYVNDEPKPVGYLSGLRLLPEYRGQGRLLARGYRFLKELHADRAADYYLTTIAEDNHVATAILTSRRAGLPTYQPWGRYFASVIVTKRQKRLRSPVSGDVHCRDATIGDQARLLEFWRHCGPSRQFFPECTADDLFHAQGLLKGLHPKNISLAFRGEELIGTLGIWDQRSFKQIVVCGYADWLAIARPLYNTYAWLRQRPVMPRAGSAIDVAFAAVPVIRENEPGVVHMLLRRQLGRLSELGVPLLLWGLHEDDPLLPIVREYADDEYVTRLYLVHWDDEQIDFTKIMSRVPYLELGGL